MLISSIEKANSGGVNPLYWKLVVDTPKDAGILGLQRRRIQPGARDEAWLLRALCNKVLLKYKKDGEAIYSQQKQVWELTVAQTINSLLPNSDLNWRK